MIESLFKSILTLLFFTALITPAMGESRLQSILANGELRVGTTGDWNPMSMIDPDSKERTGFDIDIANELASENYMSTQTTSYALMSIAKFVSFSGSSKSFTFDYHSESNTTESAVHQFNLDLVNENRNIELKNQVQYIINKLMNGTKGQLYHFTEKELFEMLRKDDGKK